MFINNETQGQILEERQMQQGSIVCQSIYIQFSLSLEYTPYLGYI